MRMGTAVRKIAIFTGNRSEYGLLNPILRAVAADPRLEYYLLAGGAHLIQDFGHTLAEIKSDGFKVYREVRVPVRPQTRAYTSQSIADVVQVVSCILSELAPDFVVIYGDRFESFGAMIAATQMKFPAAHVEGGDYTEGGTLDDSVRHAMTKLAHLHFTTNAQASERVLRSGEEPWRVFNVGLPVLDLVRERCFAPPEDLVAEFDFDLARPIVLFCQHSVGVLHEQAAEQVHPSLEALAELAADGFQVLVTHPNNDAGGQAIIEELNRFRAQPLARLRVVPSLGRYRFHGLLNLMGNVGVGVMAGNSSAGIKETPAFGCPAVNIGSRQQGRLRGANVIDVGYDRAEIVAAIRRCAGDAEFRSLCQTATNPYGGGSAGRMIAETLATIPLDHTLLRKKLIG